MADISAPPPPPPLSEDSKRTDFGSAVSTLGSAPSFLLDFLPKLKAEYRVYEDYFFKKVKDELMIVREHPDVAIGVAAATGVFLMRGPRKFLFRQTFGRFQNEEALFDKAEHGIKELNEAVTHIKEESKKLLQRASHAEDAMQHGQTKLKNAGREIQRLVKSIYRIESEATDLMDELRQIPGRNALKLRAEVASMASLARQNRSELDKKITEISELGIAV